MFCQCGAQQGYPHDKFCPYPYYRDDDAGVAKWEAARSDVHFCECENPAPGYDGYCTNVGCNDPVAVEHRLAVGRACTCGLSDDDFHPTKWHNSDCPKASPAAKA